MIIALIMKSFDSSWYLNPTDVDDEKYKTKR